MKKILILLLFCGFWANAQQYHDKGAKFEFATNEGDTITVNTRIPIIDEFGLINYYVDVADLLALNPAPVLEWGNITGTLSDQTDLQGALNDKADQSALTAHTSNGSIHFTQSAISITESQVSDLKDYLRGDVNDTNGSNKLTLGSLEVVGQTTLQNGLNLTSIPVGTSDNILTLNQSTGDVEQRVFSLGDIDIANEAGVSQFPVGLGDQLRIQGSGDTSISFDGVTNTINITSVPGSGTGGAVTSFNGRTGGVVSQAGDYSTAMVNENTNLYFTEPRVRATPLTGLTVTNTPISSTNTFIQALGRLQGQINNREVSFSKNTAFNKNFGTSAGTVAQGNHTHTFSSITSKPTTISGYGITDAYTKGQSDVNFLNQTNNFEKTNGYLLFKDDVSLRFGDTGEFRIVHGSDTHTYFQMRNEGNLLIRDNDNSVNRFILERTTGNLTATGTGIFGSSTSRPLSLESAAGARGIQLNQGGMVGSIDWNTNGYRIRTPSDQVLFSIDWADGLTNISGDISASNLSGTNTGDQIAGTGLSGTSTLSVTNIAAGSSTVGALRYNGTTKSAGRLYGGSSNPSNTTRLNYDGHLFVSELTSIGDVTANSDRRLKKNIKRIDNALAIVQLLGGYEYDRIDIDKRQAGVLAQEVEEVFPIAVSTADDERKTKSVAYNQLIALLIEAVKEQQIEIEQLKTMINEK